MTVLQIVGEPLWLNGMAQGRELEERVKQLMQIVAWRSNTSGATRTPSAAVSANGSALRGRWPPTPSSSSPMSQFPRWMSRSRRNFSIFGKITELAETGELFLHPLHPYTEALLSAIPKPDPDLKGRQRAERLAARLDRHAPGKVPLELPARVVQAYFSICPPARFALAHALAHQQPPVQFLQLKARDLKSDLLGLRVGPIRLLSAARRDLRE